MGNRDKPHPVPGAVMVDVGEKPVQRRRAVARGRLSLQPATVRRLKRGRMPKGDVLTVAEVAGIQAAKRTSDWIPLCHPLPLSHVAVRARLRARDVEVTAEVSCHGRTGVEMEALTAVSAALLTVYDMCKKIDRHMRIVAVELLEKTKEPAEGGRS